MARCVAIFHGGREDTGAGWNHHLPRRDTFHCQSDTGEHLTWVTFTMVHSPLSHTSVPLKGLHHVCKKIFEHFFTVQNHLPLWGLYSRSHYFLHYLILSSDRLTVITGIWYLLVKLYLQEYCQCLLSWHLMNCLRRCLKMLVWTGELCKNTHATGVPGGEKYTGKNPPRSPANTWNWFAYLLDWIKGILKVKCSAEYRPWKTINCEVVTE